MKTKTLLLLFVLAACHDEAPWEDYRVSVNKTIQVEFLSSLPSSGYRWIWSNEEPDDIVFFVSAQYVPVDPAQPKGGPKKEIWTLKGVKPGKKELTFYYKRPWETVTPLDSAFIKIRVQ